MATLEERIAKFHSDNTTQRVPGYTKTDGNMASLLPTPSQNAPAVSNDIDTWVRSLPQGLSDAALNTYIYSNSDLPNNNSRDAAYKWYKEIYGLNEKPDTSSGDIYQQMYDAGITDEYNAKRWLQSNGYGSSDAKDITGTYMGLYGNGSFTGGLPAPTPGNGGYGDKYYDIYAWARKIYDRKKTPYPDKVEEIKKYLAAQDETDLTDDGIISIYKNLGLI